MPLDTAADKSCETNPEQSCCGGGCHTEMAVNYNLGITQAAADRAKSVVSDGQFLRVYVYEGGCAGMKVGFDLDDTIRPGDVEFHADGAKIVADTDSLQYIDGTTVDYIDTVAVSRFALINPNAHAGCGCGSFSKGAA
jgi:iron-sulfur cluster assembly accessory protein